jgi:aldose 1-epimerase
VSYSIIDHALATVLHVENRGQLGLPFGLGFHPWFPRTTATMLMASATGVQLQDERHLPTETVPIELRPDLDFCRASPLPPAWVNNAFLGWRGRAEIVNGPGRPNITLIGSVPLNTFILYSPSAEAGFFCFEPVTHAVDAHHRVGLTRLEPGETMSASMVLRVSW